jgi:hypothetical protein
MCISEEPCYVHSPLKEGKAMSKSSQAMESFSRFVIAVIGAAVVLGAAAWVFAEFGIQTCSADFPCRTASQMSHAHY